MIFNNVHKLKIVTHPPLQNYIYHLLGGCTYTCYAAVSVDSDTLGCECSHSAHPSPPQTSVLLMRMLLPWEPAAAAVDKAIAQADF